MGRGAAPPGMGRGPRGPMRPPAREPGVAGGRFVLGPRGRVFIGPRGMILPARGRGRGRGRGPLPPESLIGSRWGGGQPVGVGAAPPEERTAAPLWMTSMQSADDDDDFVQPAPVSAKTSTVKALVAESSEESGGNSSSKQPAAAAQNLPPWAKPYEQKSEKTPEAKVDSGRRRSSLAGGMPPWGPKATAITAAADGKQAVVQAAPR